MLGEIAIDENTVFETFSKKFNLKNSKVLEIGGRLTFEQIKEKKIQKYVSIDPVNKNLLQESSYQVINGFSSSIPFESNYFDYVFSCDAFEHISDLEETLEEINRVLKPGGILYTHFGPIWSGPDGHHLDFNGTGLKVNFWEESIIPHWGHLKYDENQLKEILLQKFDDIVTDKIIYGIYHSSWINRLSYKDYLQLFVNSNMIIRHLETCDEVDYKYSLPNYDFEKFKIKEFEKYACRDILAILSKKEREG